MIDLFIGQTFRLILLVLVAVFVAQNVGIILSVLLGALLMLAIARLLWPTPRR